MMNLEFHTLTTRQAGIYRHGKIQSMKVWMVLMCFILAGCASPPFQDQQAPNLPPTERATNTEAMEPVPMFSAEPANENSYPPLTMVLMPGDEIEISFLGAPDLGITQRIRRDGRISLRLMGEMIAGGKTPAEVRAELIDLYGSQIQFKEVTVKVLTPPPIFVLGAVRNPGRVDMSRPLSALDAIAEVGGFNETEAKISSVIIIRNEQGRCRGFALDFSTILRGRDGGAFYLQPYDIVYVPRTLIVKIDQWVDQYFQKIVPSLGLRYDLTDKMAIYR